MAFNPNPNRGFATFLSTLASKLGQPDNSQNNAAKMFETLANERVAKAKIAAEQQKSTQDLLALKAKIGIEALGNLTSEKNRILQDDTLSQEDKNMALKDIDSKRLALLSDLKAFDLGSFAESYVPPRDVSYGKETATITGFEPWLKNIPPVKGFTGAYNPNADIEVPTPTIPTETSIGYDAALKAEQKRLKEAKRKMKVPGVK